MKWILFTGKDSDSQVLAIRSALETYKAPIVVCTLNSQQDATTAIQQDDIESATHAVVLNSQELFSLPSVVFFTGFFIGKEIPLFVNGTLPKELCCTTAKTVSFFSNVDSLVKAIHDNFPQYIAQEKKQLAHQTLFREGVPLTPDFFAFHIAANHERLCKLFLEAGLDVNCRDASGTPMLCMASRHNRKELLEWLIASGAAIDAISKDRGYSAVMDAVWKSNTAVVKILVDKKANLNFISRDGQSVLVLAVGTGNEEICRLLVENGADPSVKDSMGMSALDYAHLFKKDTIAALFEKYA